MDIVHLIFRWIHILMGIMWIGLLYFFNYVNGPFAATMDGETKKKVVPELLPRALYWFRWGAAWTWFSGLILLALVFYHSKTVFDDPTTSWSIGVWVMLAATFLAVFLYDALAKSGLGKNPKVFGSVAFVCAAIITVLFAKWAGFGWRGFNIHVGAMFGTTMAFNVWYRIWPAQQKIIRAVKEGAAPDSALVALAGSRSRHNTYMSIPLFWTMMNQHTIGFAGGAYGIPDSLGWLVLLVAILLGWHIAFQFYKMAAKVKGF